MSKIKNINVAIDTGTLKLMLDRIGKLEGRIVELETKLASVQGQTTVNNTVIQACASRFEGVQALPFSGFPSQELLGGLPGETEWVR